MQKFLRRLERFSQSLLSPLSYLSAAGLLLVLGALLTSKPLCQALPVLQWAPLQLVGQLLYNGMMVLINNLSVILCVGVAAVRAKTEKQEAALLALMAYLVFLTANHTALEALGLLAQPNGMTGLAGTGQTTILGIQVVDTGVASGIVLGFAAAWLFNRTCEKQFYGMITQLYSGLRWSFLWLSALAVALGSLAPRYRVTYFNHIIGGYAARRCSGRSTPSRAGSRLQGTRVCSFTAFWNGCSSPPACITSSICPSSSLRWAAA